MLRATPTSAAHLSQGGAAGAFSFGELDLLGLREILRNLRPADLAEIEALLPRDMHLDAVAPMMIEHSIIGAMFAHDDVPAAAIGLCELRPGVWDAWSWGTVDYRRCAPAITQWCRSHALPALEQHNVHRLQVLTLATYAEAHRWIEWLGLSREGVQRGYGKGGEDFVTYAWVKGRHWPVGESA